MFRNKLLNCKFEIRCSVFIEFLTLREKVGKGVNYRRGDF